MAEEDLTDEPPTASRANRSAPELPPSSRVTSQRMRQIVAGSVAFILFAPVRAPASFCRRLGAAALARRGLVLDRRLHVRRHLQPGDARPRPAHRHGSGSSRCASSCWSSLGAWVAVRFDQLWPWLPYPGRAADRGRSSRALIGTLIGLPAAAAVWAVPRLITLMAAAAITVLIKTQQFPNGGGGFWGRSKSGGPISQINRPSIASATPRSTGTASCVAIVMFLIAFWHVKSKPGAPGRPSGRAKPRRSRPVCARPSTSCGRSRWRRSSPASPVVCSPRRPV